MTTTSHGTNLANDADGIDNDSVQGDVHSELVHEFAGRQGVGSAVTIVVALVVAGVLWNHIPAYFLLSWTGLQVALAIASWLRWRPFTDRDMLHNRSLPSAIEAGAWKLGSGVLWGVVGIASHVYLGAPFDTFVLLIIAGMVAGGTSMLSAFCEAGHAFVAAVLLPTSFGLVLTGTPTDLALAALMLLYMAAMLGTVRTNNRAIREVISARFENDHMRKTFEVERQTWLDISNTSEAFAIFDEKDRLYVWNARYAELMQVPADLLRRGAARTEMIRNRVNRQQSLQDKRRFPIGLRTAAISPPTGALRNMTVACGCDAG